MSFERALSAIRRRCAPTACSSSRWRSISCATPSRRCESLPGSAAASRSRRALEPDGSGTLAVSDLGDGVLPEVRERLFDAFVTTKRGGLGLGLSICRSVVEAHGGSIRHQQNEEGGAAARCSRSRCPR